MNATGFTTNNESPSLLFGRPPNPAFQMNTMETRHVVNDFGFPPFPQSKVYSSYPVTFTNEDVPIPKGFDRHIPSLSTNVTSYYKGIPIQQKQSLDREQDLLIQEWIKKNGSMPPWMQQQQLHAREMIKAIIS